MAGRRIRRATPERHPDDVRPHRAPTPTTPLRAAAGAPPSDHRATRLRAAAVTVLAGLGLSLTGLVVLVGVAPGALASRQAVAGVARVTYAPPVPGELAVLRAFERPAAVWSAGHRGVDLPAADGDEVLAPADGVVSFAGPVAGRPVVTVTHPDGLRSSLEPVDPTVTVGQAVTRGGTLGTVDGQAASHCAPSTCLHWGVRRGETYLDPLSLLGAVGPVVLLP